MTRQEDIYKIALRLMAEKIWGTTYIPTGTQEEVLANFLKKATEELEDKESKKHGR